MVEPVSIGRDPQHPLTQRNPYHGVGSAFADAADHLFVGQHRAQGRTPVDRCFGLVREPVGIAIRRDGLKSLPRDIVGNR